MTRSSQGIAPPSDPERFIADPADVVDIVRRAHETHLPRGRVPPERRALPGVVPGNGS